MKISIISGSQQNDSNSMKTAQFMSSRLQELSIANEVYTLDLSQKTLPLWDASIWSGDREWAARLAPIADQLKSSDAFIVIAPEYHGMVPAALKNFFLMWGNGELAHKPALLTAVSAGAGGAYPIAELRMSSYKNNRIAYMPEHLIIRNVDQVLNQNIGGEEDQILRQRIDYNLNLLAEYAKAHIGIRESGVIDLKTWRNGM